MKSLNVLANLGDPNNYSTGTYHVQEELTKARIKIMYSAHAQFEHMLRVSGFPAFEFDEKAIGAEVVPMLYAKLRELYQVPGG